MRFYSYVLPKGRGGCGGKSEERDYGTQGLIEKKNKELMIKNQQVRIKCYRFEKEIQLKLKQGVNKNGNLKLKVKAWKLFLYA